MTVWNREPDVLLFVIRMLRHSLPPDWEVVVADDGSTINYEGLREVCATVGPPIRWIPVGEYEALRIAGGFNNPSRAFNVAVAAADTERIVLMSSDVIVKPRVFRRIEIAEGHGIYCPGIIDLESQMQYCGPSRVFPMPWFLATTRSAIEKAGGWDEEYLKGLCFEDNDFVGRLAIVEGRVLADWSTVLYHISHEQPAYNVRDPEVAEANQVNRRYTVLKWRGVPFDQMQSPFDMLRSSHETGLTAYDVKAQPALLEATRPKHATALR